MTDVSVAEPTPVSRSARTDTTLGRLLRRPVAAVAAGVVVVLVVASFGAPILAPHSPTELDFENLYATPSSEHLAGTDEIGRDLLTRLMYGGRTSIAIALAATLVAMFVGVVWGFSAALRGGWLDDALMRVADLFMAVPVILLGLVLVAAFGASIASLIVILGLLFAPATARIARSVLQVELRSEYYLAAVSTGASRPRIVGRELLPNTGPVLLARGTLVLAEAIFVEASLSFVGLGVQPPETSWGTLLKQGYSSLYSSYWYPLFPGFVIFIAVLALNTLGDQLQKVLDAERS